MHLIDKDSKVRAAAAAKVAAEAGESVFRQAGQECAARVSALFEAEHGTPPHASWLEVREAPGDTAQNLRTVRAAVSPPTEGSEVILDGDRVNLPSPAGERTSIPVPTPRPFSWVGETTSAALPAQALFSGWDADTGLMVFATK